MVKKTRKIWAIVEAVNLNSTLPDMRDRRASLKKVIDGVSTFNIFPFNFVAFQRKWKKFIM